MASSKAVKPKKKDDTTNVSLETTTTEAVDTAPEMVAEPKKDNAPTFAPATEKLVKVKLACDHRCTIGGTTYHFKKNEVYDVPYGVKRVLASGDLLRPLN